MTSTPIEKTCKSTEWFTPERILDRVRKYFGFFYDRPPFIGLDPATTPDNPCKADCFLTKDGGSPDGFTANWSAHLGVFLNPEYGKILQQWVAKMDAAAQRGAHIVALLPGQRFETKYWQDHAFNSRLTGLCFVSGRIAFLDGSGNRHPASNLYGSMIYVYNGDRYLFAQCFDDLGPCFDPVRLRPPPELV